MNTKVAELAGRVASGMEGVLVGADGVTLGLLIALLSRGHVLIEGVPGTGKTLAVRMLALLLGLDFRRIAFTPDLMPSDVIGTTVFNPQTAQFSTRSGPIVANVVLADEVNRTPPKTQSALLEAMEEGRVTIDGVAFPLPQPFLLCATQNPIEYEGTYPLPEAQLDRFLVKVESGYPAEAQELELLARAAAGFDARTLEASNVAPVTSGAEVIEAQAEVRRVHLSDSVRDYTYRIVAFDARQSPAHAGRVSARRRASARRGASLRSDPKPRLRNPRRRKGRNRPRASAPFNRSPRSRNRRRIRARGAPRGTSKCRRPAVVLSAVQGDAPDLGLRAVSLGAGDRRAAAGLCAGRAGLRAARHRVCRGPRNRRGSRRDSGPFSA